MNLKLYIILLISLPFIISSCKKDKLGISQNSLTGHWLEVEPAGIIQLEGTNHEFHFNANNTFTLKREYWTDILFADSCFAHHFDFVAGTYSYTNNQFLLIGKYSNAQFTTIQPNVCGESDYAFASNYSYKNGILTLNANQDSYYQIALHKQ